MTEHRTRVARLALVGLVVAVTAYFLPPMTASSWLGGLVSPASGCTVTGVVTLAGRTDHAGAAVTAEGGEPVTTDATGAFNLKIVDVADLSVAHRGYLGAAAIGVTCNGSDVAMAPVRLIAGDTNEDMRIDLLDLTAVAAGYGSCADGSTFDARSDLNGSGCTDMLDLVLLGSSYQTAGPVPWAPEPSNDGGDAPASVSFATDVDPILQADCRLCHGDAGGLMFKSYDSLMAGGISGPAVVAFQPEASSLYLRLTGEQAPAMPPGGVLLADDDMATIRQWIEEGAQNN
jgi:hypothetical protein